MSEKIAIIIDDHPVTHLGCRRLLSDAGYGTVLGASDGPAALREVERITQTLAVLDLGLPGIGGLQLVRPLLDRAPQCAILVFTMNESPALATRALEAGAMAVVSKGASPDDFLAAVAAVETGEVWLERRLAIEVATLSVRRKTSGLAGLTPREHQVLRLIGKGMRYEEIAGEINVSYKTVANTASALKRKLSARSLPELMRVAVSETS